MRPHFYVLNDVNQSVPVEDMLFWANWMEHNEWHVALTDVKMGRKQYHVSTVFLGIDHNFSSFIYGGGDAQPILFETMVSFDSPQAYFETEWLNFCERYSTWGEAEIGHEEAVRRLKNGEILRLEESVVSVSG